MAWWAWLWFSHVGWVLLPQGLVQVEVAVTNCLLDPHRLGVSVPDLSQALSAAHSKPHGAISPDGP